MADNYWIGGLATAVAQVGTVQVTAYDAGTTYNILAGGIVIATTIAQGSANATASALSTNWNASTHPYATGVTATVATDTVTLTADTAGVPFVVTTSESGGAGTIGDYSATTANAGPHSWDSARNWSNATVPIIADEVIIQDTSNDILWGLDQSAVDLDKLTIKKSFTGKIGRNAATFATSEDGATVNDDVRDYRQHYLKIESDRTEIGQNDGPGTPAGSTRIKLDFNVHLCQCVIYDTASSSAETGRPAVRILANNSSTDVFVVKAPGGVGICAEEPHETATVGDVALGSDLGTGKVFVGIGTTLTNYYQQSGVAELRAAATITLISMAGGTLSDYGSYVVTTGTCYGGTWYSNHISASVSFTTLNIDGGKVDFTKSEEARTVTTLNMKKGTLKADDRVLTVTTFNESSISRPYTLTVE